MKTIVIAIMLVMIAGCATKVKEVEVAPFVHRDIVPHSITERTAVSVQMMGGTSSVVESPPVQTYMVKDQYYEIEPIYTQETCYQEECAAITVSEGSINEVKSGRD